MLRKREGAVWMALEQAGGVECVDGGFEVGDGDGVGDVGFAKGFEEDATNVSGGEFFVAHGALEYEGGVDVGGELKGETELCHEEKELVAFLGGQGSSMGGKP